jgi:3-hydroxyacyl-[acyl-carrier-protein] dehydratase
MKDRSLNIDEIMEYLEITPPFLMIDYVERLIPGKSCYAIKGLKKDDWFFECHLEREKLMPGALQIEAMLQTLVLAIYTIQGHEGKLSYVTDINTKLLSSVSPDSQLDIYADLFSYKRGVAKGVVKTMVGNAKVCQGEFTLISPHDMPLPKPS